jgi:hypothetical protein
MRFVRLLVRGGILALFGAGAVVAMTVLFSAQIRFDQAAELQIRGHTTPRGAPIIVTAAHGLFAETGEAHASPSDSLSTPGEASPREATTGIKPLVHTVDRSLPDPLESRGQAVEPPLTWRASVSDLIEAEPAPKTDSRFSSVRVNRPGAAPRVYRVPKER